MRARAQRSHSSGWRSPLDTGQRHGLRFCRDSQARAMIVAPGADLARPTGRRLAIGLTPRSAGSEWVQLGLDRAAERVRGVTGGGRAGSSAAMVCAARARRLAAQWAGSSSTVSGGAPSEPKMATGGPTSPREPRRAYCRMLNRLRVDRQRRDIRAEWPRWAGSPSYGLPPIRSISVSREMPCRSPNSRSCLRSI
jgi:hypothetical protein